MRAFPMVSSCSLRRRPTENIEGIVYVTLVTDTHQVWGVSGVVVGQILVDYGLKITGDIKFGIKERELQVKGTCLHEEHM
jgi:hypothetical protein